MLLQELHCSVVGTYHNKHSTIQPPLLFPLCKAALSFHCCFTAADPQVMPLNIKQMLRITKHLPKNWTPKEPNAAGHKLMCTELALFFNVINTIVQVYTHFEPDTIVWNIHKTGSQQAQSFFRGGTCKSAFTFAYINTECAFWTIGCKIICIYKVDPPQECIQNKMAIELREKQNLF